MNYATKQLTRELRELAIGRGSEFQKSTKNEPPPSIREDSIQFSEEVVDFLRKKREYAEKTRSINMGRY